MTHRPLTRRFVLCTALGCTLLFAAVNVGLLTMMRPPTSRESSEFMTWAKVQVNVMRDELDMLSKARK